MYLYIIIITDPDMYITVEVCFSVIHARNTILDYKRWPAYDGYSYEIKEAYVENIMEIK